MDINQQCHLIQKDLFYYDIVSAFPTILEKSNYDFKDIDLNNKTERNIFIGKEQRNNQVLSNYLNDSVKNLVDFYLDYNEINDEDVIFRQKDGFIINKMLAKNNLYIEMKLRFIITLLIISKNRDKMIYFDEFGNVTVKGVRYYYPRLDDVYKKFFDLNFYDKDCLCIQLQNIKDSVVKNMDKSFFGINGKDKEYIFIYKNNKKVVTHNLDYVIDERIDKEFYFNVYFKPFVDSVFIEEFYG